MVKPSTIMIDSQGGGAHTPRVKLSSIMIDSVGSEVTHHGSAF